MAKDTIKADETNMMPPTAHTAVEPELLGKLPTRKSNGQVKDPRTTVERGLLEFDVMAVESQRLENENTGLRERVRLLELEIQELNGSRNIIESRIASCVAERDQAVHAAGELRGVLNSVAAICVRYHDEHQG